MPTVVQDTRHPKLESLLDLWQQRCTGRPMPARRDFSIEDFRPWLGHLALIEVVPEPLRFRVRLAGTIVTAYEGADDTGRYLDEVIAPDELAQRLEPYVECARVCRPVFDAPRYPQERHAHRAFHRLLLPCSSDGSAVDIIILAVYTGSGAADT